MSRFSRILAGVGVVLGVVLVGAVLGWWGSRAPRPGTSPTPIAPAPAAALAEATPPAPNKSKSPRDFRRRVRRHDTNETPAQVSTTATNASAEWEDKVDQILTTEGKDSDKAKQMLEMFPTLPEDGQEEVAGHLSNLVADEDYTPLGLGKLLTNASLPEPVLDVLMGDILNRPNAVKLPVLLEVARTPQHPDAGEAKDLLELFLDPEQDYGNDWTRWQAKMETWLKENPD